MKRTLLAVITTIMSVTSTAQLSEHVKSIDESEPPQVQSQPPNNGDQRRDDSDYKIKSDEFWSKFMWAVFGPAFGIVLMPIAPINYHMIGFPNRSQDNTPANEGKEVELAIGSGTSFSVSNLNLKYRIESSSFMANLDADRERGFWTNFYSIYYVYTPNWKKQLKTGVGIGIKGFNYTDENLQTQGSQSGFMFNFPAEYFFRESKWSIYYTPQLTYYMNNMIVFEIKLGSSYEVSKNTRLFISIDNKSVVTKKDLTYGSLGVRYLF